MIRKHRDYGPLNISRAPGGALNGINVRQWDKLARAQHLVESGADPENESLRDTYVDQANYGSIAALVLDGLWPSAEGQATAQRPANHVDDGQLKIEANLRHEIRELNSWITGQEKEVARLQQAMKRLSERADMADEATGLWKERAEKAEKVAKQWASKAAECVGRTVNAERDARDARMQAERQRYPAQVVQFPKAVSADPHGEWKEQQERKAAMERHPSSGERVGRINVVKGDGDDEW